MNYFYLIIVTKEKVQLDNNLDVFYINDECTLIDDHHINYQNEIFEFEYLIYSNKAELSFKDNNLIINENNIPITNFYFQTSLEHIYYITENKKSRKIYQFDFPAYKIIFIIMYYTIFSVIRQAIYSQFKLIYPEKSCHLFCFF